MAITEDGAYEWDDAKAEANAGKHGVTFDEAASALDDPRGVNIADAAFPERVLTIGVSALARILLVVSTERGDRTRIISARRASPHERLLYERGD